jgi:lysophospholipase L1-like esterase
MVNSAPSTPVPDDVVIRPEARRPVTDPTLGIPVSVNQTGTPRHRLVAIGDSLTHGFQSGAIFNTGLSYPALIAEALGWKASFRYPTYNGPGDGLPLNLESLARALEQRFGGNVDVLELLPTVLFLRDYLDKIEDYWERGEGSRPPTQGQINHDLAVYGWDLRNTLSRTAEICQKVLNANPPKDDFLKQVVEHHNERAAIRVLNSARDASGRSLTPLQAAAALGAEGSSETGTGDGIETLIVLIGANNALGSILTFKVKWSGPGYDDMDQNDQYTVWRPIHFQAELDKVIAEIKNIRARHVIIGTVPHVTIVPFARGVGGKLAPQSRYYPYYTLPWISDKDFNPQKNPNITGADARAIDSAIDQYNDLITDAVRQARREGRDWYLFEVAGLLDRLASRRYIEDPDARPSWWEDVGGQYPLPPELQALSPVPDSRFFISNSTGRRVQGGLFSLDGIHPTTIGYGIMAQEIIKIMERAGVKFYGNTGNTPLPSPVKLDFNRLIALDSLISKPPRTVASVLDRVSFLDSTFNLVSSLIMSSY